MSKGKRFNKGSSDRPLSAEIRGRELVIRVGLGTIAWAFEHDTENNRWDDDKNNFIQGWKVSDRVEFAKDVRREALREEEDGSTPLIRFLDQLCRAAADSGSLGIEESGEVSEGC
jgi:hypothetical protein